MTPERSSGGWFQQNEKRLFDFERERETVFDELGRNLPRSTRPDRSSSAQSSWESATSSSAPQAKSRVPAVRSLRVQRRTLTRCDHCLPARRWPLQRYPVSPTARLRQRTFGFRSSGTVPSSASVLYLPDTRSQRRPPLSDRLPLCLTRRLGNSMSKRTSVHRVP